MEQHVAAFLIGHNQAKEIQTDSNIENYTRRSIHLFVRISDLIS